MLVESFPATLPSRIVGFKILVCIELIHMTKHCFSKNYHFKQKLAQRKFCGCNWVGYSTGKKGLKISPRSQLQLQGMSWYFQQKVLSVHFYEFVPLLTFYVCILNNIMNHLSVSCMHSMRVILTAGKVWSVNFGTSCPYLFYMAMVNLQILCMSNVMTGRAHASGCKWSEGVLETDPFCFEGVCSPSQP